MKTVFYSLVIVAIGCHPEETKQTCCEVETKKTAQAAPTKKQINPEVAAFAKEANAFINLVETWPPINSAIRRHEALTEAFAQIDPSNPKRADCYSALQVFNIIISMMDRAAKSKYLAYEPWDGLQDILNQMRSKIRDLTR